MGLGRGATALAAGVGATGSYLAADMGFFNDGSFVNEKARDAGRAINKFTDKYDPSEVRKKNFRDGKPTDGFDDYNQYLAPYQDIYTTKNTGWRYKLPYMEDQQRTNRSQWATKPGLFRGAAQTARDITLMANTLVSPGVYIDQAKNYTFDGDHKSYTVSFPLMNTMSQEHILRNWQLLFLLTYQNRPNRIDRVQIAPPKIYEAMIPGVWWCRHAFISNMTVDFVGNRRKMTLMLPQRKGEIKGFSSTPQGMLDEFDYANKFKDVKFLNMIQNRDGKEIGSRYRLPSTNLPVTTIIPDAYQVTITMTELVPESQNTMFAAIHKPSTITTSPLDSGTLGSNNDGTSMVDLRNFENNPSQ